jgi:hypothetical protein
MSMWPIDDNTPFDDVTHWVGNMREKQNETEETDRGIPEQPPIQTSKG